MGFREPSAFAMSIFATLLAGTAAGSLLIAHLWIAGTAVTLVWIAATWHGMRLLRSAQADHDRLTGRVAREETPRTQTNH